MRRVTPLAAGIVAVALALGACSGGGGGGGDPETTAAAETFTVANPYATESLDPHSVESAANGNTHANAQIYSRLIRFNAQAEIEPDLATEWSSNEDGTEWTFTLREGVQFSDGTPLTAEDVVASFERLTSIESPLSANFPDVTAATPDESTVVFTSPTSLLLGRIALLFVTKAGVTDADFTEPIGSGPYVVESFSPAESLVLNPNESYYGDVPTNDVEFKWIPEVSTRLTALQTGEIDATWGIPDDQLATREGNEDLVIEATPSTSVITMWMNASRPALESAEVRNALWSAVDFETIISSLFPETGTLSDSVVSPMVFGYSPQDPKTYDPDAAQAALEAAGFDFSQELQIQYSGLEYTQFIEAVASDLQEIGVNAVPTQKEPAVFLEDLLALNWDINFQALGTAAYDAATNVGRLYPCDAGRTGYCNEDLDELLAAAGNTTDEEERADLYDQAITIIWDDAVGMYPMLLNISYAWRSNVTGFEPDPLFMPDLSHVGFTE